MLKGKGVMSDREPRENEKKKSPNEGLEPSTLRLKA